MPETIKAMPHVELGECRQTTVPAAQGLSGTVTDPNNFALNTTSSGGSAAA